jgi:hypothetical protein
MTRSIAQFLLIASALTCGLASAQDLQNFVYQSSYNNEMYVIQQKDNFNLDLYTEDGRLIASMSRKKASEKFKGTTYQLANKCPEGKGKIEFVDILSDRVMMRVERPTIAPNVPPNCMQLILPAWDNFQLVRHHPLPEGGARTGGGPPTSGSQRTGGSEPATTAMVQDIEGFTIALDHCEKRGGASVTCFFSAVNHQADRPLMVYSGGFLGYGDKPSDIVDSAGIQQTANNAILGSSQSGGGAKTEMVADIVVPGSVAFGGVDPGVNRIARLVLSYWTSLRGVDKKFTVTFRNIPLVDPTR